MEILFCDLCNESIPASHLERGMAFRRGGRLTCADCDRAMGGGGAPEHDRGAQKNRAGAEPKQASDAGQTAGLTAGAGAAGLDLPQSDAASSGSSAGIALALLALFVSGVGLALFVERVEQTERSMDSLDLKLTAEMRQGLAGMRAQESVLDNKLVATGAALDQQVAQLGAGLEDRLRALADQGQTQVAALDVLRQELQSMAELSKTTNVDRAAGLAALGERLAALETDQRFYADRLAELDEQLRAIETMRPGALPGPVIADATGLAAELPMPWEGLLPDLDHQHPGIRMEAVYELAETGDGRVVPYLIPKLGDEDLFVRMATTRALMDLEARSGVPGLIDTLEDPSGAVRDAAMVALRRITGREFGFEPQASVSQRSARVKAWRDWFEKEGQEFLLGS